MKPENWIDGFKEADGAPPRTLGRFFLWCLKGSMPVLVLAAVISAGSGVMEVATALLLGLVIDGALENGPAFLQVEWLMLFAIAAFFLIVRPMFIAGSVAMQTLAIGPNLTPLVLSRLHRYVLGHAVQFFDNDFAGRIAQKQMQTSRAVTDVTVEVINVVAFAAASLIGSAVLLTTIDWRVASLLAVWLVVYVLVIRWFMPRVRLRSGRRAASRAMLSGQIVDTVTNIKTVKLFAHDAFEDQVALDAMRDWRGHAVSFGWLATGFRFCLMTIAGTVPVLLVGMALWLWSRNEVSAGDIAATGAVSLRIAQMTGWVSFTLMAIYANLGEVEDGMKTLTPAHGLPDRKDAIALPPVVGNITFDDVSYTYGDGPGGITGIDLQVRAGEKIGVVGASGAGKSTLVAMVLRLYDPETGRILIDGVDISTVTQESLRGQIGMVTQETAMFNRSALDNIRYGRPDATDRDVIQAAKRAEADEFITDLKDFRGRTGYDAHLGERGVKLSGGQRQRIALARAILKDAPILVLDEATSALDSEVEALIQEALTGVMAGKTVIAIAHRLSTLSEMDRILVLDQGRIVEDGTHDDLLEQNGFYARFWARQSGGFIGETIDD